MQQLAGVIKEAKVDPKYIQAIENAVASLTVVKRLAIDNVALDAIDSALNVLGGIVDSEGNLVNESQLNEEKVGFIDVSTVKQMINKPEVQKMANTLKDNPGAAKKLAAALSNPEAIAILSGESISEEYDGKKLSAKDRIVRFLKYSGVGAAAGALAGPLTMLTANSTDPEIIAMYTAGAIVGALIGSLGGAAMTNAYKDKLPIQEDNDLKDQITQVLAFGKK